MKKIYLIAKEIMKNTTEDHVSEFSAQCAYYTILSFIPFLILLLTMIQYTNINQDTLFKVISKILPSNMEELVVNIIQEVYSKSLGTISISVIFILWSAGKGLFALTKGLQNIYKVKGKVQTNYFYLRFKSILETIFFIILIVIGLIGLVFGKSLLSLIKNQFKILYNFKYLDTILLEIAFLCIVFFVFLLLYKFIVRPHHKIKTQIIGAVFGTISLKIISLIFSVYLEVFKDFSIMYGSLTTVMLIMMWTYACFYIIFLGAEINKSIGNMQCNKTQEKSNKI